MRISDWSSDVCSSDLGAAPTAEWSEAAGTIALWTAGGWRFAAPFAGMRLLRLSDHAWLRCEESGWSGPEAVASPSGGAVVDSQARAAIDALILHLSAHGLLIAGCFWVSFARKSVV